MNGAQILKAADTLKKHKEKPVVVYDDAAVDGSKVGDACDTTHATADDISLLKG